jgi:hypothetical protein
LTPYVLENPPKEMVLRAGGVAQVTVDLSRKHETLSSNLSSPAKKKWYFSWCINGHKGVKSHPTE